jgi:hypothetical protein
VLNEVIARIVTPHLGEPVPGLRLQPADMLTGDRTKRKLAAKWSSSSRAYHLGLVVQVCIIVVVESLKGPTTF